MESFTITVDLKSFYNDYRAKSVIFVDTTTMKKVKHVVHHIKVLFGIESDACMFSQDNFVPGAEDCRVLKSLPNIRLDTQSTSLKPQYNKDKNIVNDECQDVVSVPTAESNQSEISYVEHVDHSHTGHASKKKKHKRKRVNIDNENYEYSSSHQDRSDDVSNNSNRCLSSPDGKVRKISKSNERFLYSDSYCENDSIESKQEDCPNGAFYGKVHRLTNKIDAMITAVSSLGNGPTSNDTCNMANASTSNISVVGEAPRDLVESDSNTNTETGDGKPKRKRVRKRKKAAKPEDIPQDMEIPAPQLAIKPAFKSLKLSRSSANHIFFPEEAQQEIETSTKTPEAKQIHSEDSSVSVSLKYPDNKTEEQELNNQCSVTNDAYKGLGVKNQPSVSKDFSKEHDINDQTSVPENLIKSAGTTVLQTVTTKPKLFSVHADRGLGKLLSLVRSGSPPVFQRKKIVKTEQLPVKQITPVAVAPQAEPASKSTSTSQSNEVMTPVKAIPEANTKISFKILKMSDSYCPELSNSITAIVKETNLETQELLLKLINGAEECKKPKGKFDLSLEDTEEEPEVDEMKLKWGELIEPSICP